MICHSCQKLIEKLRNKKNKIVFLVIFLILNVIVTSIVWELKNKNNNGIIENENYTDDDLKNEIKILQERIASLNIIISEKQKLINQLELQGGPRADLLYKPSLKNIGGAETQNFAKKSFEDIRYELENTKKKYGVMVDDRTTIFEYTPTIWPVNQGYISSAWGHRISPFTSMEAFHEGVDIAADVGTKIYAAAAGEIIFADYKAGYGRFIVIQHKYGYATAYGHCDRLYVSVGSKVKKGQLIATVGNTGMSTGPHVHFEVRINGIPVDPELYMISKLPKLPVAID